MNSLGFTILLTTDCNLNCVYCYEKKIKKNKYMTVDIANNIVSFIKEKVKNEKVDSISIRFHGGEPFLNYKLIDFFITKLNKELAINIAYHVTTNGTITNESICDLLKHMSTVSISLDGSMAVNDKQRIYKNGQGSYCTISQNIPLFLKNTENLIGRMTVTKNACENLYESFLHILSLGFLQVEIETDFTCNDWNDESLNIIYINELKKIAKYIYNSNSNIKVPILTSAKYKTKSINCMGGRNSFTFSPEGYIYPCMLVMYDDEYLLGSVTGSMNKSTLDKLDSLNGITIKDCIGCARYDYCAATRCKFLNKQVTGSYALASPILCNSENVNVEIGKYFNALCKGALNLP